MYAVPPTCSLHPASPCFSLLTSMSTAKRRTAEVCINCAYYFQRIKVVFLEWPTRSISYTYAGKLYLSTKLASFHFCFPNCSLIISLGDFSLYVYFILPFWNYGHIAAASHSRKDPWFAGIYCESALANLPYLFLTTAEGNFDDQNPFGTMRTPWVQSLAPGIVTTFLVR